VTSLSSRKVRTARGAEVRVLEGGAGRDVVFLHDVAGQLDDTTFLERIAEQHHLIAPELPGYGESTGEELLEDMLDFTLHGWDVVAETGADHPILIGHGMGGMIAAEMAAACPAGLSRLVLVAPLGIWLDEHPVPDLFSMLPYEFPRVLFADAELGARLLLSAGEGFGDLDVLKDFYIGNTRRLGTAGKILFPIPDRRLAKRLYRVTTPTTLVWGENDALLPLPYAERWAKLLAHAALEVVPGGGHMVPYENPDAVAAFVGKA